MVLQACAELHGLEVGRPLRTVAAFRHGDRKARPGRRGPAGHPGSGARALRRGAGRLGPAAWRVHRRYRQVFG